ncbi:MAG: hypothetical protein LAN59_11310 [Acidobacteriia bacterium]|nr:hypothetical protein [Terriglobia bacterium]
MAQPERADRLAEPASLAVEPGTAAGGEMQNASAYCPRCSARLAARSCKLICPSCGYYMSCSDFY